MGNKKRPMLQWCLEVVSTSRTHGIAIYENGSLDGEGFGVSSLLCVDSHVYIQFNRILSCSCEYRLNGVSLQLKPCHFAVAVLRMETFSAVDLFILTGVSFGFKIIDSDTSVEYDCQN